MAPAAARTVAEPCSVAQSIGVSPHWHPDLKVRRLQPWLVELRMVFRAHATAYGHWTQWYTLRDTLDIHDDPLWVIAPEPEAMVWAVDYLLQRPAGLASLLRRWGVEPAAEPDQQLQQLEALVEDRAENQSELERRYQLLTVRPGPFRAWGVLDQLRPHIDVG